MSKESIKNRNVSTGAMMATDKLKVVLDPQLRIWGLLVATDQQMAIILNN